VEICRYCQSTRIIQGLRPDTIHHAELRCQDCDRHLKWIAKPKEKESTKREADHHGLLRKYSEGYCEICLRLEEELPPAQSLKAHHKIEYDAGGTSDHSNIQILCTPCHQLVHHQRTYLGHYTQSKDLSDLIAACEVEMKRTGYSWRAPRVLDFCEMLCKKRSRHFMR